MAHELTHAEASEFLGVFALDALETEEREAVERHLRACGLCRTEVQEHMEMAGLLSTGVFEVPLSVWDRISEDLEGTAPPLDLAPIHAVRSGVSGVSGERGAGGGATGGPFVPAGGSRPRADRGGRRRVGLGIGALVAAATVAASVIGVLGLKVIEDGRRIDDIAIGVHGAELERTIDAAKADPEVVKVDMRSPDGQLVVEAWMLPDGRGYLAEDNLPTLAPDRNYQLWAVVGGDRISVGLLGSDPQPSAFVASGQVGALAITEEEAGGVVASLQQPLVAGQVRQA